MRQISKHTIAGAVTLEVERIAAGHQPFPSEGAAYKAEWDRRGSDALIHCRAFAADAARMAALCRIAAAVDPGSPHCAAGIFAGIEAGRQLEQTISHGLVLR